MIALTGAGGFVGSVVLGYLNLQGITDVVLFDDLPYADQFKNLSNKKYISLHSTDEMFDNFKDIECVIHIGANSSTLEKDWSSLYKTNVLSTRYWNEVCSKNDIPFIFTSSAAVYGNGQGPLNHYAFSKIVSENEINGVVLRLFNVYGPNEYHKGRMASTVYHWYNQLRDSNEIKIFKHSNEYRRDFIWVEDVAKTIFYFIKNYQPGVYDLGQGKSNSFEEVADCLIDSHGSGCRNYINMPNDLQRQYQNNTCADTSNLIKAGIDVDSFLNIEQGIDQYLNYLQFNKIY